VRGALAGVSLASLSSSPAPIKSGIIPTSPHRTPAFAGERG
jgi:hypothetical protein